MMARAHIAVGMAAACTIFMPGSVPEALPVIAGASAGCLICDIDCEVQKEARDSSRWRILTLVITVLALIEDHLLDAGMWRTLTESGSYWWCLGVAGFALTCAFAGVSGHRGFSHSILALALETGTLWLVFPAAALPFAAAFVSHQVLDIMNKRPVRLLYPMRKGFSLGWFYADRLADRVFAAGGTVWLILAAMKCLQ